MPDNTTLGRSSNLNLNLCFTKIKLPPIGRLSQRHENNHDDKPKIIKNYNTMYEADTSSRISDDLAAALASRRFFLSAPGTSKSIVESYAAGDVAAVVVVSADPYADFRRSMEEMMEARKAKPPSLELMNELLLCYLALNPDTAHKFIVRAFSDLVHTLLPSNNS